MITFAPALNGMASMLQCADPCAIPEAPWFVDQFTVTAPDPPDVVPLKEMVEDVVVAGTAAIVSANGCAAGADVAGTVELLDPEVAVYSC